MKSALCIVWCLSALAALASGSDHVLSHSSNFRAGPSSRSKLVTVLPSDTPVNIISRQPRSGYVKIETTDGAKGWVLQRNVAVLEGGEKEPSGASLNLVPATLSSLLGEKELYPNPESTPGAIDARVKQSNIQSTICKAGYTDKVRPSTRYTNKIKKQTMASYGFTDSADYYELDHLISLELGGCPDCVTNLWPERWGDSKHPIKRTEKRLNDATMLPGARQKDVVEHHLRKQVCNGSMTLRKAQELIASDWYNVYENLSKF